MPIYLESDEDPMAHPPRYEFWLTEWPCVLIGGQGEGRGRSYVLIITLL